MSKCKIFITILIFGILVNNFFEIRSMSTNFPIKVVGIITDAGIHSINNDECDYLVVDKKYRVDVSCVNASYHLNKNGEYEADVINKIKGFGEEVKFKNFVGNKIEIYGNDLGKDWFLLDRLKDFNLKRISLEGDTSYIRLLQ